MSSRVKFEVSLELPEGADLGAAGSYVHAALTDWRGSLKPPGADESDPDGDPMHGLDPSSVVVTSQVDGNEAMIADRQGTHGVFRENTVYMQTVKDIMHLCPNWRRLSSWQREALEMVVHKQARLLYGDPNHLDHWEDQIGYLKRVVEYLKEDQDGSA